jgi:hypothetical protein
MAPNHAMQPTHVYEIHPRKDHRGVDLISDALPYAPPLEEPLSVVKGAVNGISLDNTTRTRVDIRV